VNAGPTLAVTPASSAPGRITEVFHIRFTPAGTFKYWLTSGLWAWVSAS
jgi:hypothetical protein